MFVVDQHGQDVKTALLIYFYKIALDVSYTTIPKLLQNKGANIKPRGIKVAASVISAVRRITYCVFGRNHTKSSCVIYHFARLDELNTILWRNNAIFQTIRRCSYIFAAFPHF
jgi:hypothetical protein